MDPKVRMGATVYTMPTEREIVARRVFDAPRGQVFVAWTSCEHVPHWMLGPDEWTMPVREIDLRVGGRWRFVWRKGDGETEMEMDGEYREVARPEGLVSTERWGGDWPEALNVMVLSEEDGRTTMTPTMRYQSEDVRDRSSAPSGKDTFDPHRGLGLDALDEGGLSRLIRHGIVRMVARQSPLERTVLVGGRRVRPEVVSKSQVPSHVLRAPQERVHVDLRHRSRGRAGEVPASRDPVLPLGHVAEGVETRRRPVHHLEIGALDQDVDHRLRAESRHAGAADMVDRGGRRSQGLGQTLGFVPEELRPAVVVGNDHDRVGHEKSGGPGGRHRPESRFSKNGWRGPGSASGSYHPASVISAVSPIAISAPSASPRIQTVT